MSAHAANWAYAYSSPPLEGGDVRGGSLSLDNYVPDCTVRNRKRRRNRAYQRVMSGLSLGGNLKFITLTSTPGSNPEELGRCFYALIQRIRRGSSRDPFFRDHRRPPWKFEYVRVRVPGEGYGVIHVIARGGYIPQRWLSQAWKEIRGAPNIWIKKITYTPGRVGNYIISQYVSGQKGETWLSWSWSWVYRGFCVAWKRYKRTFRTCAVDVWRVHLWAYRNSLHRGGEPPPLELGITREIRYEFGLPPSGNTKESF